MSNLEYGYMVHLIKLMFKQKLRMMIEEVVPMWKLCSREDGLYKEEFVVLQF